MRILFSYPLKWAWKIGAGGEGSWVGPMVDANNCGGRGTSQDTREKKGDGSHQKKPGGIQGPCFPDYQV